MHYFVKNTGLREGRSHRNARGFRSRDCKLAARDGLRASDHATPTGAPVPPLATQFETARGPAGKRCIACRSL